MKANVYNKYRWEALEADSKGWMNLQCGRPLEEEQFENVSEEESGPENHPHLIWVLKFRIQTIKIIPSDGWDDLPGEGRKGKEKSSVLAVPVSERGQLW